MRYIILGYRYEIYLVRGKLLVALLLLFAVNPVYAGDLKPFTTDGCSVFPDGTLEQQSLWANCCIRHDLAYWKGGTSEEKQKADTSLASCVSQVGEPEIAAIMLAGVRIGGSPYYPTFYRWAYGLALSKGYKALSEEEKLEVKHKLEMFKVIINSISEELN